MSLALQFISAMLITSSLVGVGRAEESSSDRLHKLIDDSWQFDLREDPLFATRTGDHRHADMLPRERVADQQRRLAARKRFLTRLQEIDRAKLGREDQTNYDIFRLDLENSVAESEFQSYLTPITNRSGFHISFPELPKQTQFKTVKDYENYISRLTAFDRYTQDHIELMRSGIEQSLVLPAVVLEGYRATIEPHIVKDPSNSLLYAPFEKYPGTFSVEDQTRLSEAGRSAIANHVVPGYRQFFAFMTKEYVPAARGSIGASALPHGREFYRHRVRRFTTLDLTPQEVHQIGLSEVKRIRAEMLSVIDRAQFEGSFAEFIEFLRTDPQFYAETPEQLMKEVAFVLKKMDGQLPRLFNKLPRSPYGIRKIPDYIAPRTTTAYYMPPSGDGSQAGFYYVNTYNLKSRPLFEVQALSLHEAVPGHHLQIALQQELDSLPNFRRYSQFTVFIEGWALYAERLGLETGFYQDPYSDFGRLSFEMWRACRLVVDTGVHYLGWTRKQAIDMMASNTALSLHNIQSEVDRYISWPGQALAYKIGELEIRKLREDAETRLGEKFDIREFHDVVLENGGVPLTILRKSVERYIRSRLK